MGKICFLTTIIKCKSHNFFLSFFIMNSGTSNTRLSDMLTDFTDYVFSFYGDKKEALYPLFNVETDKQVDKKDILSATHDYLKMINERNDDLFTWGDGDSLDRERVRDILVIKYGYDKEYYGGSVLWEDFANEN